MEFHCKDPTDRNNSLAFDEIVCDRILDWSQRLMTKTWTQPFSWALKSWPWPSGDRRLGTEMEQQAESLLLCYCGQGAFWCVVFLCSPFGESWVVTSLASPFLRQGCQKAPFKCQTSSVNLPILWEKDKKMGRQQQFKFLWAAIFEDRREWCCLHAKVGCPSYKAPYNCKVRLLLHHFQISFGRTILDLKGLWRHHSFGFHFVTLDEGIKRTQQWNGLAKGLTIFFGLEKYVDIPSLELSRAGLTGLPEPWLCVSGMCATVTEKPPLRQKDLVLRSFQDSLRRGPKEDVRLQVHCSYQCCVARVAKGTRWKAEMWKRKRVDKAQVIVVPLDIVGDRAVGRTCIQVVKMLETTDPSSCRLGVARMSTLGVLQSLSMPHMTVLMATPTGRGGPKLKPMALVGSFSQGLRWCHTISSSTIYSGSIDSLAGWTCWSPGDGRQGRKNGNLAMTVSEQSISLSLLCC